MIAVYCKELGAAASYASAAESYTGLASGVFDAAIWGAAAGAEKMGFFEVAKNFSKPNIANVAYTTWVVNQKAFESLPKDIQNSFHEIFERHYWERTNQSIYDEAQTIARQKKKGVQVVTLPEEDQRKMRQIAMKLADKEAKADPELAKWIEKMKAFLTKIGEL
jgi:TRAP-type C4-dicarboxylate transport system substrate-binding protein